MFERFDEQARRALFFARYEVSALGSASVDTGHLLLALLSDAKGAVHAMLSAQNITYADVRQQPLSLPLPLPPLPEPAGNYVHAVRVGDLMFLAGKGAGDATGKVGRDISVEQAYQIARATGMILLSALAAELGSLDRVVRIGVASLPHQIPIEIEAVVEVRR